MEEAGAFPTPEADIQAEESTKLEPQEYIKPRTCAEIRSHIEWVIHSVTQSVNDRTFDAAPGWKYIADDFIVAGSSQPRLPSNTKADLAEGFRSTAAENPDFQLGVPVVETEIDLSSGVARAFANSQGTAGSVTRKHTVVFTFVRDKAGRWMARNETTVFGVL
ncbi:hypothetical protein M409DRAFT_20040 [Zasmidium cellare ATCC 36951]|uniref:DUF4440 domain-containing protein n=1 Tax=Zasmidium cellare ATCC 36951 TaxID=1080233 RepID=A0A6A6CVV2_ZASCE|nr:uncharacterized protein M409DRAFT_20040 [Zasmidium cellare ATCC 36951]KAF2169626.1 hypothetical protein M409DRAFT_20040 [Zasmidium cellare ATCC 36951]